MTAAGDSDGRRDRPRGRPLRIAFYAPLKPPDDPVPSGDRTMARRLVQALALAGHEVELACRLRSRDPAGDPARQARLRALGARLGTRYAARVRPRPDLWFTYHLYYKAPDWVGPTAAARLGIPYLVAEASVAPKRADGPWDIGYRGTLAALALAAAVIPLNPANAACLPDRAKLRDLPPFLDAAPLRAARPERGRWPALDPALPWILAVGMMRPGAKLASYRLLVAALERLAGRDWRLLVVGDGAARGEVEAALAPLAGRCHLAGALEGEALAAAYASCDLLAWPAIDEAYGMALLEAQAAGRPVVAGRGIGVSAVVSDGETGLLTGRDDPETFAADLARLLDDPALRRRMGAAAEARVAARHDLPAASRRLDAILRELVP
ncbi:Glycosyltransferase involved in cell wall bisynthesis [Tistlia consotensis]|uniref:Glycosyltransferase involved in cell wall bisynthesis n=1 Tax=Tistlia consotensis USBA 355 TaxID=560819 RepID=A0A1Y6BHG8_9PROT|nr:glycosyltransferase family 4 protein [Tistlia consotensis]SMF09371.1 Glycosyltransferase involved in cell wall bisynthesis [Tistlia consotensis USBA 355]SNR34605.1 Glycosyltransferase involved in cell wall bisynthesis [Tistlia consotensis]